MDKKGEWSYLAKAVIMVASLVVLAGIVWIISKAIGGQMARWF